MALPTDEHEGSPLLHGYASPEPEPIEESIYNKSDKTLSLKLAATMISFAVLGLFNSSIGAALPLISSYYRLTDLHVSFLFLAGPIGYIMAAQSSDAIHRQFGQRGIAILGPLFQIIANASIALHPTFGIVMVAFAIQGLGTGLLDGSWCAWAGSMERANTISGLLHGSYSVGAAAGPFFIAILTTNHKPWWLWYGVLAAVSTFELLVLVLAFRSNTAAVYRQGKLSNGPAYTSNAKAIFKYRATWLCAAYFLAYVGTETAISGWVVSFMLRHRHASPYLANLSSSGFWIGMAIGRLILGFGTDKIGVRRATVLYMLCAIGFEVLFAIVTSTIPSVILMTVLGFIMGPLFPSGVVVLTRLLPEELHIAAVSFVASLGQVGGALLPFAIGTVIQTLGIGVFRYAILLQTVLALSTWFAYARLPNPMTAPSIEGRQRSSRND